MFFDDDVGFTSFDSWEYDWWRPKVVQAREQTRTYLPAAIEAGVKVCLATDSTHASLWREAKLLVDIGASPQDALLAVTKNGAELLGMADRLGTLVAGKLADIISVAGDPLADMAALREVRLVMKAGKRYESLLG